MILEEWRQLPPTFDLIEYIRAEIKLLQDNWSIGKSRKGDQERVKAYTDILEVIISGEFLESNQSDNKNKSNPVGVQSFN